MKASFVRAVAAATFMLTPALIPVRSAEPSDTAAAVKDDARTAGHSIAHGATTVGHAISDKSREAGHAIADGTRSARGTIRDDSHKAGHAIADGARHLGRTVRDGFERLKAGMTGKSGEPKN